MSTPADDRRSTLTERPDGDPRDGDAARDLPPRRDAPTEQLRPMPREVFAEDPWPALQSQFVDDPAAAVGAAAGMVDDLLARLRDAAARPGQDTDTEGLRQAFHRYRSMHRSLTGMISQRM